MNRCRSVPFDFREGFFFDGGDDDFVSLGARSVEHEKRKLAVAGDEAEFFAWGRHDGAVRAAPGQSSICTGVLPWRRVEWPTTEKAGSSTLSPRCARLRAFGMTKLTRPGYAYCDW